MGRNEAAHVYAAEPVSFETDPGRYRHIKLSIDGPVARIVLDIQEDEPFRPGYTLKLNSYDLGVDIELADAVVRLRFEHPEVAAVVITSAREGMFCSGANIFMLASSTHSFKVNFCKFTNETRLAIEDATENSGQVYVAALNGTASGGGYELPLACKEIYLVDDRKSAVALPEVPYLGVLPGTGGLTRVVDKRKIRRDRADLLATVAEGVKGKRAAEWGVVDAVIPSSRFAAEVDSRARAIAGAGHAERRGIMLDRLDPIVSDDRSLRYRHVALTFGPQPRVARLEVTIPDGLRDAQPLQPDSLDASWFPLRAFREIDDALLRLRFNHPEVGVVLLNVRGRLDDALAIDSQLQSSNLWLIHEVRLLIKRVLKRMDVTAKSFFSIIDLGSAFAGCFFELAVASDRSYMLDAEGTAIAVTASNAGDYPMANGLTRLQTRFIGAPDVLAEALAHQDRPLNASEAEGLGLVTASIDALDWDDEIRLAVEERASLSPDALTGMEANLRFAGPETIETKIFGRLSAWQNWIFQRPNATGDRGALSLYGRPESAEFDWQRT